MTSVYAKDNGYDDWIQSHINKRLMLYDIDESIKKELVLGSNYLSPIPSVNIIIPQNLKKFKLHHYHHNIVRNKTKKMILKYL